MIKDPHMIISHKFKFAFIHIPKTGGSFIRHILLKLDPSAIEVGEFKVIARSGHLKFFILIWGVILLY